MRKLARGSAQARSRAIGRAQVVHRKRGRAIDQAHADQPSWQTLQDADGASSQDRRSCDMRDNNARQSDSGYTCTEPDK